MDKRTATLVLNMLPGIGPLRVRQLLSIFGDPDNILSAPTNELARIPGIGAQLAETIRNWTSHCDLDRELDLIERGGVTLVTRDDPVYPDLLGEIHDPPLCLYVRGDSAALQRSRYAIAFVGSRRTTHYGTRTAQQLAEAAALAGWVVVSGLARGIDTVAHRATVDAGGSTIAVLGSGLARVYPQDNVELARRITENKGAVISEFPMTFRPDRRTFPMRNRIIAGLSRGCVVVEAGARSGSLITANQALEQGRQVFAVPGPVTSPQSRGCHQLIKEGAKLVENLGDILEEFAQPPSLFPPGSLETAPSSEDTATESACDDLHLSPLERKLMGLLAQGELGVDELIAHAGEPAPNVLTALLNLEMRHLVRQLPGKRVVRTNGASLA